MDLAERLNRELTMHRAIAPVVTLRRSLTFGRDLGFIQGRRFRAMGRTEAGSIHIETMEPVDGTYRAAFVAADDLDGLPVGFK